MKVAIAYALPERQILRDLELHDGATVETALLQSGLLREFPAIGNVAVPVGIYGRIVPRHTVLQEGDRVEIYRALLVEPKAARRKRAGKR